jgi:ABC-type lipoprotein export system ATPase subunit
MTNTNPLIRLQSIARQYDDGTITALNDINLVITAGECLAITGPSGSGKTSLLNILSGIDSPTSGQLYWKDLPIQSRKDWAELRGGKIGIVFQEFNLLPTLTAIENVEVAMMGHGISGSSRRMRAIKALERVGLLARTNHLPNAMSGGERQRVAVARAMVNGPEFLLADEPTGNLDSVNAAHIMDLLIGLQEDTRMTLALITHDEKLADRCKRCIKMSDGKIVEDRILLSKSQLMSLDISE